MKIVIVFSLITAGLLLNGCAGIGQVASETGEKTLQPTHISPTESNDLSISFQGIIIDQTSSADVLDMFHAKPKELISQSESVIAAYGEDVTREKCWFNMAAFGEEQVAVSRKYFVSGYDRPREWFVLKEKVRFDGEMKIDSALLNESYSDENARRIAVIKEVLKVYNNDVMQVQKYNQNLANIAMLVNQSLNIVLAQLEINPVYAQNLDRLSGFDFDHPTMNAGKLRMLINDQTGVVRIKVKIGSVINHWNNQKDVAEMDKW